MWSKPWWAHLRWPLVPFREGGFGEPREFERCTECVEVLVGETCGRGENADGASWCTHPAHLEQHLFSIGHDVDDRRRDNSVENTVVEGKRPCVTATEI